MEAGIRADLNSSRLSAVPRRDTQRAILQFVNDLRSFSRVHAAEGKAYMTSWDAKETIDNSTPAEARNPRSCGFATPVLKPRVVLRKQIVQGQKSSEPPSTLSNHVKTKSASRIPSKEDLPLRGRHRAKRNREFQSDEEKRLYERREKKRAKREIMRPVASKEQTENHDQPQKKSKSKKMPTGLALMYGFTATNVGRNRLTVKPSLRSGVFGKGKASVQARSGQSKLKGKSLVFSEEEFLKSATIAEKCRHDKGEKSAVSGPQSSHTSSECTDDMVLLRHRSKHRSKSTETNSTAPLAQKRRKTKIPRDDATEDGAERSSSKSKKAQSVIWDIEKDDGVLPMESSSVLTSKTNTVLLNIRQEQWLPEFSSNKRGVFDAQVQESSVQQKDVIDGNDRTQHSVIEKEQEQDTSSSTSSVCPSESPSQVVYAHRSGIQPQEDIVSKYFARTPSLRAHPSGKTTQESHTNLDVAAVPLSSEENEADFVDLDYKKEPARAGENCDGPRVETIHRNTQPPLKDIVNGSDWLLSDPILSPTFNRDRNCGAELFHLDGLEEIQSDFDFHNALSDKSGGLDREEGFYLAGDSDLNPPHDRLSIFEDALCGQLLAEDDEDYEYDYPISHSHACVENVEEAYNQPIPLRSLTEWDCRSIQTISECNDVSDILLNRIPSPSIGSSGLIFNSVGDGSDNLTTDPFLRFDEGRCLLLGANGLHRNKDSDSYLGTVESDVARRLVGHWMPQKY